MLTLTEERTAIIDVFAGCGGMGVACAELHRHCLCLEHDEAIFAGHLCQFEEISMAPMAPLNAPTLSDDTNWEQYEVDE